MILKDLNNFSSNQRKSLLYNIHPNMSLQDIKSVLSETSLNFDLKMASKILVFLTQNGIKLLKKNTNIYSLVAAAIISQTELIPCTENKKFTHSGIQIQSVLSHFRGFSKEQFLLTLASVIAENVTLKEKLSAKVKKLQLSYGLFKKYHQTFQQLWALTGISFLVKSDLLSIFWIVYIFVKNGKQDIYQNWDQQVKFLYVLLQSIFSQWISCVSISEVQKAIQRNFGLSSFRLCEQQFKLHQTHYFSQMQKLYNSRYEDQNLDMNEFSRNAFRVARFLDDLVKYYNNGRQSRKGEPQCRENYVDQISYLDLRKPHAPQIITKCNAINLHDLKTEKPSFDKIIQENQRKNSENTPKKEQPSIVTVDHKIKIEINNQTNNHNQISINNQIKAPKVTIKDGTQVKKEQDSSNSKQPEQSNYAEQSKQSHEQLEAVNSPTLKPTNTHLKIQNIPTEIPARERKPVEGTIHCLQRIDNLGWVRDCLNQMNKPEKDLSFRKVFSFVKGQNVAEFQKKSRKKLLYLVEEFIPKCLRKDRRVLDLLAFFKFLVLEIYQNHGQTENAQMFKQIKTFNSILCLSSDIFSFAHGSVLPSYREECQIFEVPLIQALKPINWIGKNIEKPAEINNYLYSLQKRIVIQEIWQDETGYNLIQSQQMFHMSHSIGYNDMIVWKRLVKHILGRVEELAKEVKLQFSLIKRIQNLMELILKQKPFLLHKNKIDQIIICCMTSFLNINQIHKQRTLEKVLTDYGKIEMSSENNKYGLLGNQREMSLIEFYNEVFLPEVQDIVNTNIKDIDFLLTPILQSYQAKHNTNAVLTPFSMKYLEKPMDFGHEKTPGVSGKIQGVSGFSVNKINETLSFPMLKAKNNLGVHQSTNVMVLQNGSQAQNGAGMDNKVENEQEKS